MTNREKVLYDILRKNVDLLNEELKLNLGEYYEFGVNEGSTNSEEFSYNVLENNIKIIDKELEEKFGIEYKANSVLERFTPRNDEEKKLIEMLKITQAGIDAVTNLREKTKFR